MMMTFSVMMINHFSFFERETDPHSLVSEGKSYQDFLFLFMIILQ